MKRLISLILFVAMAFSMMSCAKEEPSKIDIDKNELVKLCQLSTIELKIHACVESTQEETSFWKKLFNSDSEYFYIVEYDGSFKIGIDFKELNVNNQTGVVTVKITKPYLMSSEVISKTISDFEIVIYNEDGIVQENKKLENNSLDNLLGKAQQNLKEYIETNKPNFDSAEKNGEKLIENYITQIGLLNNIEYKIVFEYSEENK